MFLILVCDTEFLFGHQGPATTKLILLSNCSDSQKHVWEELSGFCARNKYKFTWKEFDFGCYEPRIYTGTWRAETDFCQGNGTIFRYGRIDISLCSLQDQERSSRKLWFRKKYWSCNNVKRGKASAERKTATRNGLFFHCLPKYHIWRPICL